MFNKKADKDYTTDKLPDNRFKLFWDLYANRISLILGVGLLCLLFLLPSFAVTIISNLKVYKINLELNSGYTTASEAASDIFATINTANLALVPCLALLGVGVAGICGVLRRLTWQDGVLFWYDFRQSIKENGGIFASTAAICGGLNWATQYCLRLQHFDNGTLAQVSLAVAIVATVLFAVVAPMLLCQSLVYKLPYFAKLKNAFMLSMRQPLVSFGLLVGNAAPASANRQQVHICGVSRAAARCRNAGATYRRHYLLRHRAGQVRQQGQLSANLQKRTKLRCLG